MEEEFSQVTDDFNLKFLFCRMQIAEASVCTVGIKWASVHKSTCIPTPWSLREVTNKDSRVDTFVWLPLDV